MRPLQAPRRILDAMERDSRRVPVRKIRFAGEHPAHHTFRTAGSRELVARCAVDAVTVGGGTRKIEFGCGETLDQQRGVDRSKLLDAAAVGATDGAGRTALIASTGDFFVAIEVRASAGRTLVGQCFVTRATVGQPATEQQEPCNQHEASADRSPNRTTGRGSRHPLLLTGAGGAQRWSFVRACGTEPCSTETCYAHRRESGVRGVSGPSGSTPTGFAPRAARRA